MLKVTANLPKKNNVYHQECSLLFITLVHIPSAIATVVPLRMILTLCVHQLKLATVRASGPIHKEHSYVLRPVCVHTCVLEV